MDVYDKVFSLFLLFVLAWVSWRIYCDVFHDEVPSDGE